MNKSWLIRFRIFCAVGINFFHNVLTIYAYLMHVRYNKFECLSYEYFLCFNANVTAQLLFATFLF